MEDLVKEHHWISAKICGPLCFKAGNESDSQRWFSPEATCNHLSWKLIYPPNKQLDSSSPELQTIDNNGFQLIYAYNWKSLTSSPRKFQSDHSANPHLTVTTGGTLSENWSVNYCLNSCPSKLGAKLKCWLCVNMLHEIIISLLLPRCICCMGIIGINQKY